MCKGNKFVLMICTCVMNLIQENMLNNRLFTADTRQHS